jgi:methionyl-tRNA formyltransferase
MRIVFFGTGSLATPSFEALVRAGHELAALVTAPGSPGGPDVPAGAWRIPVLEEPTEEALGRYAPDLQVMVGYDRPVPLPILRRPRLGTVKAHASLLPRHRGPEPVLWTILNGDAETGVTTIVMGEGIDTGPVLLSRSLETNPDETAAELAFRLARLAAEVLVQTVDGLAGGTLTPVPQSSASASEAPRIDEGLRRVDWTLPADAVARRIRAFGPTAALGGTTIRLLRAAPAGGVPGDPGVILSMGFEGIVVACGGQTTLRLTQLQIEGLRAMSPSAVITRLRVERGARFT